MCPFSTVKLLWQSDQNRLLCWGKQTFLKSCVKLWIFHIILYQILFEKLTSAFLIVSLMVRQVLIDWTDFVGMCCRYVKIKTMEIQPKVLWEAFWVRCCFKLGRWKRYWLPKQICLCTRCEVCNADPKHSLIGLMLNTRTSV